MFRSIFKSFNIQDKMTSIIIFLHFILNKKTQQNLKLLVLYANLWTSNFPLWPENKLWLPFLHSFHFLENLWCFWCATCAPICPWLTWLVQLIKGSFVFFAFGLLVSGLSRVLFIHAFNSLEAVFGRFLEAFYGLDFIIFLHFTLDLDVFWYINH